jgi:opacity protein-like surface antigen
MNKQNVLFAFVLILGINCFGQERENAVRHVFTGMFAFSFIPKAIESDKLNDILIVPTIGLNYDYHFNHRWSLGTHIDVILQQYEVERHDGELLLERAFPVAANLVCGYHVKHRWMILAGAGMEFEKDQSFVMATFGVDHSFDIHEKWDTNVNVIYDYRFDAYSSFLIGISFSYKQ